jgi:hypothetical protein
METDPHSSNLLERTRNLLHNEWLGGMAVFAAVMACASPTAAKNSSTPTHVNEQQGATVLPDVTPHLLTMTEDANPPKVLDSSRDIWLAQTANSLEAQSVRIKIMPRDILRKKPNWNTYDSRIRTAQSVGKQVFVTLSGRGVSMSEERFKEYVSDAAELLLPYGVAGVDMFNEPNSPGEMQKLKGYSAPESLHIYYEAGQKILNQILPYVKVDFGEENGWHMNGGEPAEKFFREAVVCPHDKPNCEPLKADGFAIHTYDFTTDPRSSSNTGRSIGINNLSKVHKMLDWASSNEHLIYQAGTEMPIDITEFAYLVKTTDAKLNPHVNAHSPRYLPDSVRKVWLRAALDIACSDPQVRIISFYGPLPPPKGWPGPFYMQLVYQNGKKSGSFYIMPNYVAAHPDCFQQPSNSTTSKYDTVHSATSSTGQAGQPSKGPAASAQKTYPIKYQTQSNSQFAQFADRRRLAQVLQTNRPILSQQK